jgi:serine/threonine protein kinase
MSQDYNEAIQSPATNFTDPDLRRGQAAANSFGIPLPCSGNFADVYQVRCPDGMCWAVKCFTREIPGLRERYREISSHLARVRLPFIVDFTYLDDGIRVGGYWFPVLKMQWVDGLTLNRFVGHCADKPALLAALSQIWIRMGQQLHAAEVAHGDLQHGNVLLVREGNSLALKLVDYDGMWVPALAASPSGEVGHSAYQHPRRLREQVYGPTLDRFPILLIATALRTLFVAGRPLWDKYDCDDNLLFQQEDLMSPSKSRLFYELLKLSDPLLRGLVEELLDALRRPLDETPLLGEVVGLGGVDRSPSGPTQPATWAGRLTDVMPEAPPITPPPVRVRGLGGNSAPADLSNEADTAAPPAELWLPETAGATPLAGEGRPRIKSRRWLLWVIVGAVIGLTGLATGTSLLLLALIPNHESKGKQPLAKQRRIKAIHIHGTDEVRTYPVAYDSKNVPSVQRRDGTWTTLKISEDRLEWAASTSSARTVVIDLARMRGSGGENVTLDYE